LNEYRKEIDKMTWSYSRLTTFEHCKYEFYLNYILQDDSLYLAEGNYYAEVGSFVHEILAMIFNGELTPDEATEYYVDNFDQNVFYQTRESIMDKTFETCADYFNNEDFSWLNDYEILGVEQKVTCKIDGYSFLGFIDLLLRDKRDGKIVIVDNKSSDYPFRQDGKVKANAKDNFEKYKKQMYFYSHAIHETYGEFPKELTWNHFKNGGKLATIPFNQKEYEQTIQWMLDTIHLIENEEDFQSVIEELDGNPELKGEYFYCHNLCSFRNSCEANQCTEWKEL